MKQTMDEIRREGLAALRERLGRAGMLRFLQQFESGSGDYARDRRRWAKETSLDEIRRKTASRRPRKSG